MADEVRLVGLDFGTTTSSAVVAVASLQRTATGRMELDGLHERFRSEMAFTPITERDEVDLARIELLLDEWLREGQVEGQTVFGGGALLTGLTAQKSNAAGLLRLIRSRLGDSLVATADDPCLESWLAFMGSCAALSKRRPEVPLLNLDIGGGTTNLALGLDGQVQRCGCLFLGARHITVIPGTYRIVRLSRFATNLFEELGIARKVGEDLTPSECDAYLGRCTAILEQLCGAPPTPEVQKTLHLLTQTPFPPPTGNPPPAITFSGGIGELIYRHLRGDAWPDTTCYGDLGIDLAQHIVASPLLSQSLAEFQPSSGGRATVYGLLRHATEVSGSTLFLPTAQFLPLTDLPIYGRITADDNDAKLREILDLIRNNARGGCIQVRVGDLRTASVRALGQRIADVLDAIAFPVATPLVFLTEENVGKTLGQYATRWGRSPRALLSIDEVPFRSGHYVQIGSPRNQVVPVSIYGLNAENLSS